MKTNEMNSKNMTFKGRLKQKNFWEFSLAWVILLILDVIFYLLFWKGPGFYPIWVGLGLLAITLGVAVFFFSSLFVLVQAKVLSSLDSKNSKK
jgi:uncharacterized membrane protein YhaH (DUF805 family)